MTSRMYATIGRGLTSQNGSKNTQSEDVFLVDLEGKIDVLKNVSTDLHSELQNSKSKLDALRGGFDEAQGYLHDRFSSMSQLMNTQKGTIAMSKMVLLTTTTLCVVYVLLKIALKAKTA